MTNESVDLVRKLLNALRAWLQAMDYSAFDYTNERILRLERDVERLRNELKRARVSGGLGPVREPAEPD